MKIEEFVSLLNKFDKLWIYLPDTKYNTGELPCFEQTSPLVKFNKIEFSNDSIDLYIGFIQKGIAYLKLENDEADKVRPGFDKHQCYEYMNKKIFIEAKPVYNTLDIVCDITELDKAIKNNLYVCHSVIGDTFPGAWSVTLDLNKVTFDHFKVGEPDFKKAAEYAVDVAKLKANNKVVKWFADNFGFAEKDDKYKRLALEYSAIELEILKRNNINDFGFSPIPYHTKKITPITIKVGGMSSLPKVQEIIDRIDKNKQQTTAGAIMQPVVQTIRGLDESKKADILIMLNESEQNIDNKQTDLRKEVYNIILNRNLKSNGELKEQEIINVDGFDVTFEMNMYAE